MNGLDSVIYGCEADASGGRRTRRPASLTASRSGLEQWRPKRARQRRCTANLPQLNDGTICKHASMGNETRNLENSLEGAWETYSARNRERPQMTHQAYSGTGEPYSSQGKTSGRPISRS
ncbi:hypothetical protein PM082_016633 [Marasmius tenuissimus]|nr:hypothetical protein PM082_016633 [Marasmius tenuissimus]